MRGPRIDGILKKISILETIPEKEVKALIQYQRKDTTHFPKIKPFRVDRAKLETLVENWMRTTGADWPNFVNFAAEGIGKDKVLVFGIEVRTHWIAKVGENQYIAWRSCGD